jgi:endonuclease YncB( thermonuclease family)
MAASATFSGTAHVVDGDTLRVGTELVRLSGVDAPELSQRCGPKAAPVACGTLAADWLRTRLEDDVSNAVRSIVIATIAG